MHNIIFHPDIEHEVKASYKWYQGQTNGLGDDFLNELETAFETITGLPDTWPIFQLDFRRFLLSKFPYSVIYRAHNKTIFVVAVMHNSRKPGYWSDRV
ncbi:MAG: type II toxin-antitoxin system RelE/ParE family toxin [Gammaproteobacteria bacterium]|jgi:plasmid stabilization system protein ParE|nr:type II toxin-antitoxin system RelE/ParE family toxin [Gammaproteobacteria bacterium]MBT4861880.1 type II toxin-antitoxin system RelE/ParE family toxin [Gammaproteobacteria bacterium]MBT6552386.1 type II toxin-antitoxin system RelE/ParE family toxin [Gammaproteobacteria bacterium]MBT6700801.1 type II toxin-antitoxin system RelE/ParE family toxin [Gammaproteobacteria bacterium]MBT7044004.1 type II toxin-antitoxin system RelE/ParE family toxin [Gammaproteobacteria bacterium]